MQAEGEASAAHRRAQGDAFAVRWDAGAGSAERARVDRTEAVLHAATQQRVQAEQRLHPSPLSDDVRLGRVVPVGYRLAAAGQRVRALAAALGEPLEPGEEEPPGLALPVGPPLYTLGPTGTEILARAAAAGEANDAPVPASDGSPLRARIRAGLERLG